MHVSKVWKKRTPCARAFVSRVMLVASVCFVVASSVGCAKPATEFRCPFGPATVDVENEELDGMLDDAPATVDRLREIDFECGFDLFDDIGVT